jgi:hypothetical protein
MTEFSHSWWSCDRNSVHCVNFDITLHLLLGTDEGGGGVMVVGQYCTCCRGRSLSMCFTAAVVQTAPEVFSFGIGFPLFHAG